MDSLNLLIHQILVMFLYVGAGYILFRSGKITKKGSEDIASLLLRLVVPVVIVKSYCVEPTKERIQAILISFLLAAIFLVLAVILSRLFLRKRPIDHFAGAFSNAGFIGIPLVQAALGEEAVIYIAPMIALLNLLQSTYGVAIMTGKPVRVNLQLLKNPFVISLASSLFLFFTGLGVKLPDVITTAMSGIGSMNAPLAMIVLGVYFAQAEFRTLFNDLALYKVCAVRLIVIPAVTLLVCVILPVSKEPLLALMIAASAPTGANVAVYAQLEGLDYAYASKTVVLSTLFSVISIPLVLYVAGIVL